MGELILWTSIMAAIPLALVFLEIGVQRLGDAIESRIFGSDERVQPAAYTVCGRKRDWSVIGSVIGNMGKQKSRLT